MQGPAAGQAQGGAEHEPCAGVALELGAGARVEPDCLRDRGRWAAVAPPLAKLIGLRGAARRSRVSSGGRSWGRPASPILPSVTMPWRNDSSPAGERDGATVSRPATIAASDWERASRRPVLLCAGGAAPSGGVGGLGIGSCACTGPGPARWTPAGEERVARCRWSRPSTRWRRGSRRRRRPCCSPGSTALAAQAVRNSSRRS